MGAYEILAPLGAGGMGEVYRARDTRLDRQVAVKVLSRGLFDSPDALARFEREARAVAALSHSSILAIHDVGRDGEIAYAVTELLEGENLREALRGGPLPVRKAVEYSVQIALGLAAAHEKGIVHRDLKPENVFLMLDGRVKLLDFGLARQVGGAVPADTHSPTANPGTSPGVVLGTVGYMSPEQVRGEAVDHRSDVFSFGCLLYEMLAGRRAFGGVTAAEVMAAILRDDPPRVAEPQGVPPALERIVWHCLEKRPDERFQSARDLAFDLQALSQVSSRSEAVPALAKPRATRWLTPVLLLAAGIAIGLAAAATLVRRAPEAAPAATPRLTKLSFEPGLEDEPTLSPDGKLVAYTTDERGNLDVVVVPLAGGPAIRVLDSAADEAEPSWSPDSARLAFVSARDRGGRLSIALGAGVLQSYVHGQNGDVFLVPALGGTPLKLVENGYHPAWSPDGKRLVFQSNRSGQWDLWTVAADGGEPVRLTTDADVDLQPSWSPDGGWIAYATPGGLQVIPAQGGKPRALDTGGGTSLNPVFAPSGREIVYSSDRGGSLNLWRIPFSSTAAPAGTPRQVTLGEGADVNVSLARDARRLVFATVKSAPDVWELTLGSGKLRRVTVASSGEDHPHLSPDGRTLAAEVIRGGRTSLWTLDIEGRLLAQVSAIEAQAEQPRWSPDGRQLAYARRTAGLPSVVVQRLGDLSAREIAAGAACPSWSPDGRRLAFAKLEGDRYRHISVFTLPDGPLQRIASPESENTWPSWSPDGTRIAYQAQTGRRRDLWVVPAEGGTPRKLTSGEDESSHPEWSPVDADEIMFLRNHKNVCLLSVATGRVRQLTDYVEANAILDYPSWSRDGKKVYFSVSKKSGDVFLLDDY